MPPSGAASAVLAAPAAGRAATGVELLWIPTPTNSSEIELFELLELLELLEIELLSNSNSSNSWHQRTPELLELPNSWDQRTPELLELPNSWDQRTPELLFFSPNSSNS